MRNKNLILDSLPGELRRSWGWLLGLGIVFVIMGCIGLGMLVALTLASMFVLGALFLIAGFIQIIDVFKSNQWKGAIWHALIAILYLIGGGVVIYDPVLASTVITALFAWVLIIIGVIRLIMASVLRAATGWGWLVFAGIMAIVLGVLILTQWPFSGLWVIGMFISIELLVSGWTYIFIACSIRHT